jgi:hypothetical protein
MRSLEIKSKARKYLHKGGKWADGLRHSVCNLPLGQSAGEAAKAKTQTQYQ